MSPIITIKDKTSTTGIKRGTMQQSANPKTIELSLSKLEKQVQNM